MKDTEIDPRTDNPKRLNNHMCEKIAIFNNVRVNIVNETYVGDIIFRENNNGHVGFGTVHGDISYGSPDKKTYIFSTMGPDVYVLHPNNMVSTIREKELLFRSAALADALDTNQGEDTGVYIIDYYSIHKLLNINPDFIRSIVEYYNNTRKVYPNNIEIINYIKSNMYYNVQDTNMSNTRVTLRIITFVKKEDIIRESRVFIPTTGLVIGVGRVNSRLAHPSSEEYRNFINNYVSDAKNFIEIEIVDNQSFDSYFINVGNKVISLAPSADLNQEPGCRVNVYKNDMVMQSFNATLPDMCKELGICRTQEEAITNGDLSKLNEKLRLENEILKIGNDKDRLNFENEKLSADKEKMEIENNMLRYKFKHEKDKIKSEAYMLEQKAKIAILDVYKKNLELMAEIEKFRIKEGASGVSVETVLSNATKVVSLIGLTAKVYLTMKKE